MKHLFVPYEIAVMAKEAGFDEPCFTRFEAYFNKKDLMSILATLSLNTPYEYEYNGYDQKIINDTEKRWFFTGYKNSVKDHGREILAAPLYQQLTDWFREKHNIVFELCYWASDNEWQPKMGSWFGKQGSYYEAYNAALIEAFKLIKK